jgi:hypothetical protein
MHAQRRHEAVQLARHQQQALALGQRAGRHHRQVDEDARQVEQAGKPAGDEDDVQGLDPEHAEIIPRQRRGACLPDPPPPGDGP